MGVMVANYRDRSRSIAIAANMLLWSWTKDGASTWTKANIKVFMMAIESSVTNAAGVNDRSSSN